MPALETAGGMLLAFFDTVIGPGTTNTGSHPHVESGVSRTLPSGNAGAASRTEDSALSNLLKREWLKAVTRVDNALLFPMDYSRIR